MQKDKVSICIATYNMGHLIGETLESCLNQTYTNMEIIVYDDCGLDDTEFACKGWEGEVLYYRGRKNVGVGNAFNKAIEKASGEFIILMCSDDLFTNMYVVEDIVNIFNSDETIGHVSRSYYQYIDGAKDRKPVRAWRGKNPIVLANNPSGLAFRKSALYKKKLSNSMFIESSYLVSDVLNSFTQIDRRVSKNWGYEILPYDAIAVRVHDSTSTKGDYWLKRRVSSPVLDWYKIGGKEIAKDYCSLIQIKCNYTMGALWEEIINFIKLRPLNLLNPMFYLYSLVGVVLPRVILRKLPHIYRKYIGRNITKEIKR